MELNPLVQKCNQTPCQGSQGKAPPGQGRTISDTEVHSPWVLFGVCCLLRPARVGAKNGLEEMNCSGESVTSWQIMYTEKLVLGL